MVPTRAGAALVAVALTAATATVLLFAAPGSTPFETPVKLTALGMSFHHQVDSVELDDSEKRKNGRHELAKLAAKQGQATNSTAAAETTADGHHALSTYEATGSDCMMRGVSKKWWKSQYGEVPSPISSEQYATQFGKVADSPWDKSMLAEIMKALPKAQPAGGSTGEGGEHIGPVSTGKIAREAEQKLQHDQTGVTGKKLSPTLKDTIPLDISMTLDKKKIQVACVGDSLTQGQRGVSYPALLQQQLGDAYAVTNLGIGYRSVQNSVRESSWGSSVSYKASKEFGALVKHKWDIVIVMLGTNDADTRPEQFDKMAYAHDYASLLHTVKTLGRDGGEPSIFCAIPPPIPRCISKEMPKNGGPKKQPFVINSLLPRMVPDIAGASGASIIDVYRPLGGDAHWRGTFPFDCKSEQSHPMCKNFCQKGQCFGVHLSDVGYGIMASSIAAQVVDQCKNRGHYCHRHTDVEVGAPKAVAPVEAAAVAETPEEAEVAPAAEEAPDVAAGEEAVEAAEEEEEPVASSAAPDAAVEEEEEEEAPAAVATTTAAPARVVATATTAAPAAFHAATATTATTAAPAAFHATTAPAARVAAPTVATTVAPSTVATSEDLDDMSFSAPSTTAAPAASAAVAPASAVAPAAFHATAATVAPAPAAAAAAVDDEEDYGLITPAATTATTAAPAAAKVATAAPVASAAVAPAAAAAPAAIATVAAPAAAAAAAPAAVVPAAAAVAAAPAAAANPLVARIAQVKARIAGAITAGNVGVAKSLQHGLAGMETQLAAAGGAPALAGVAKAPVALEAIMGRIAAAKAAGNMALATSLQHGLIGSINGVGTASV